jgi:hypothetical protein
VALARTQYVRSGDADIAYQVIGDGPRDIIMVFDWASHLEAVAELKGTQGEWRLYSVVSV